MMNLPELIFIIYHNTYIISINNTWHVLIQVIFKL